MQTSFYARKPLGKSITRLNLAMSIGLLLLTT